MTKVDYLVVGAGVTGCVVAERCAAAGRSVLVIDRREHIGGNAYDAVNSRGLLVHCYGPHVFHTNSSKVADYLSRFTAWRDYEHRVLASVGGKLYPIPINRTTINKLYGLSLDEAGVAAYLESVREVRAELRNSEDVVLASVGRDLCDKFFRHYTHKQWGLELAQLSPAVAGRIPVRCNDDDRYFTDSFQKMPADGYTAMLQRMLAQPSIRVELGCDFARRRTQVDAGWTVYTGPVDEYFDQCFGALPYRSLRFEHETLVGTKQFQPVGTVNYPNEHAYTRITEFKHLTGQEHVSTAIVREYPQAEGDPCYPVPTPENQARYRQYRERAEAEPRTSFAGRLAEYRYYNMDQAVAAALKLSGEILA
jgi:UDP-galactopyranose mutase